MGDGTIYNTQNVSHNYIPSQSYVMAYESISNIGCSNFEYYTAVFDCNYPNPIICQMPIQNPINQTCGMRNVKCKFSIYYASAWEWDFWGWSKF